MFTFKSIPYLMSLKIPIENISRSGFPFLEEDNVAN
jgi:hypothetical protein